MVENTLASGKMASNMVMEATIHRKMNSNMENGMKEKELDGFKRAKCQILQRVSQTDHEIFYTSVSF